MLVVLVVVEVVGGVHHLHFYIVQARQAKVRACRLGKRDFPGILKVHGRRQNQLGVPSNVAYTPHTRDGIILLTFRW